MVRKASILIFGAFVASVFSIQAESAHAAQVILPLSGWNQDIIIGKSETASPPYTANVTGFDYYESGLSGGTQGLPADSGAAPRTFTSAATNGVPFQFQPYSTANTATKPNAEVLTGGSAATPVSGILTITSPSSFDKVQVLIAAQGSTGVDWTVQLNFADGSTTTSPSLFTPDWVATPPAGTVALSSMGLKNTNGTFYSSSLFMVERDIALSTTDQAKTLNSITFAEAGHAGSGTPSANYLMVFAASGNTVPEPTSAGLIALGGLALLGRRRGRVCVE